MLNRFWRFAFRLLYQEFAFCYDFVSRGVSLGHWRRWQNSALRYLPPPQAGCLLELAHGTGDLQIDLQKAGYQTLALDRSPSMSRLAQRKLRRLGLATPLLRADALRLPLKSNSMAATVCSFPSAFIAEKSTLAELRRVLQAEGRVVIVLVGLLPGGGWQRELIRFLYRLSGQREATLDARSLRALFAGQGFRVESRITQLDGSVAQLVVLRKEPEIAMAKSEMPLDFTRELC